MAKYQIGDTICIGYSRDITDKWRGKLGTILEISNQKPNSFYTILCDGATIGLFENKIREITNA